MPMDLLLNDEHEEEKEKNNKRKNKKRKKKKREEPEHQRKENCVLLQPVFGFSGPYQEYNELARFASACLLLWTFRRVPEWSLPDANHIAGYATRSHGWGPKNS